MSIAELIEWRVREGVLYPLVPIAARALRKRAMFPAEPVWDLLEREHDEDMEERLGYLQADLERFVIGEPIDPKYLFLLSPARDAIWEIRSVRPSPSVRVLGSFAARDVFIATHYALRGKLGGWESRSWREAKRVARARWIQLFHTYQPLSSTLHNDLFSGAIDAKYFKP